MKLETIPNETWIERQLRAMEIKDKELSGSPDACVKFLVEAKILPLSVAKKHGYHTRTKKKKDNK